MLQPADEARLDSLSRAFRTAFRDRFTHLPYGEQFTDRLIVTIPAAHPETGEIWVYLDGDEVTVALGELFHCHFETYLDTGVPTEDGVQRAVEHSLDFIEDFVSGRTFLRVYFRNGQAVGASLLSAESPNAPMSTVIPVRDDGEPETGEEHEFDYVWTGPKAP